MKQARTQACSLALYHAGRERCGTLYLLSSLAISYKGDRECIVDSVEILNKSKHRRTVTLAKPVLYGLSIK